MKKIYIIMSLFWIFMVTITISGCSNNRNEMQEQSEILQTNYNYKNPIIPEGFHTVETETASWKRVDDATVEGWNSGLVIEDDKGNQFVWVPCSVDENNEIVKYGRYFWTYTTDKGMQLINYDERYIKHLTVTSTGEDYSYYEDDNKNEEVKEMVKKYGGFFIGRYELGYENEEVVVKKGCNPVVDIDKKQAVELTSNIIQSKSVQTYLITSFCYDTTIKWIEKSNHNFCENPVKYQNFIEDNNYIAKNTGESEETNNIYDFFGNVTEITTEKYSGNANIDKFVHRSGIGKNISNIAKEAILEEIFSQRRVSSEKSKIIGTRAIIIVK